MLFTGKNGQTQQKLDQFKKSTQTLASLKLPRSTMCVNPIRKLTIQ
jgi:hypothetical protein